MKHLDNHGKLKLLGSRSSDNNQPKVTGGKGGM